MSSMRGTGRSQEVERGRWSIGVDLGGTWIRLVALDADGRRRVLASRSPGLAGLPDFLRLLWRRWHLGPADVGGLAVASRGVWTRAERRRQARRLQNLAMAVQVLSDAEAAYHAALGDTPGVLILAGTGSMALGRDARGGWARAGGLGPLLGDEGSAFWIAREWLRTSRRDEDFRLARRLLATSDPVARVAALAPEVLRRASAGSPRARRIIRRGQEALADLLVATARKLRTRPPVAVSWGGSLLGVESYRSGLWRAVRRQGLEIEVCPPRKNAAEAAMRLAAGLRPSPRAGEKSRLTP